MQELLDQVERPDAVFVTNHLMTLGVLQAIAQAKLAIPADIAVVSFDDMSWAPLLQPPLRPWLSRLTTWEWKAPGCSSAGWKATQAPPGWLPRIHRKTSVARRYGAERARVSRSSPQGLRMCSSAPQRAHRTRTHLEVEVDGRLLAPGEVAGRRPLLEAQARSTVVSGPIARRFSRQVLNWSSHGHSTGR